jgi:uncharacterized membrane protein YgcG
MILSAASAMWWSRHCKETITLLAVAAWCLGYVGIILAHVATPLCITLSTPLQQIFGVELCGNTTLHASMIAHNVCCMTTMIAHKTWCGLVLTVHWLWCWTGLEWSEPGGVARWQADLNSRIASKLSEQYPDAFPYPHEQTAPFSEHSTNIRNYLTARFAESVSEWDGGATTKALASPIVAAVAYLPTTCIRLVGPLIDVLLEAEETATAGGEGSCGDDSDSGGGGGSGRGAPASQSRSTGYRYRDVSFAQVSDSEHVHGDTLDGQPSRQQTVSRKYVTRIPSLHVVPASHTKRKPQAVSGLSVV